LEENALGLSQLYQRVREDTIKRKKEQQKDPAYQPTLQPDGSGGLRHKYQELMHLQEKMNILLGEYLENREFLEEDKVSINKLCCCESFSDFSILQYERRKQIQKCQKLMQDLQHLPSLNDDLIETIGKASAAKASAAPNEINVNSLTPEEMAIDAWLYDGIFLEDILPTTANSNDSPRAQAHNLQLQQQQECIEKAMKEHYSTMDLLMNQHRWDAVFLPAGGPASLYEDDPSKPPTGDDPASGGINGIGIPSLTAMQKKYPPKSLKNLTSDIMYGKLQYVSI
jgi:hypothetical protein